MSADNTIAQVLLVELYRKYNNEFERYGQYMTAPPTIDDAYKLLDHSTDTEGGDLT